MGRKAENWIKVHKETLDSSKIDAIALATGMSLREVIGSLVFVWMWATDAADQNGIAKASKNRVADHAGHPGFFDAMKSVGWINETKEGHIEFPNLETKALRIKQKKRAKGTQKGVLGGAKGTQNSE